MRWGPDEELVKCFTLWKRCHKFAKLQTSKTATQGMIVIVCLVELALRAFLTKDTKRRQNFSSLLLAASTPSPVVASFVSGNCINLTIPLSAIIFHLIMSLLCRGLIFASWLSRLFRTNCVWSFNGYLVFGGSMFLSPLKSAVVVKELQKRANRTLVLLSFETPDWLRLVHRLSPLRSATIVSRSINTLGCNWKCHLWTPTWDCWGPFDLKYKRCSFVFVYLWICGQPIRAFPQLWVIVTNQSEFFPQLWVNPIRDLFSEKW